MKRSKEMQEKYAQRLKEVDAELYDFRDDKLILDEDEYEIRENSFPYDNWAAIHHLLVPKGTIDLTHILRHNDFPGYESIIINQFNDKSVAKPHAHLIVWKKS